MISLKVYQRRGVTSLYLLSARPLGKDRIRYGDGVCTPGGLYPELSSHLEAIPGGELVHMKLHGHMSGAGPIWRFPLTSHDLVLETLRQRVSKCTVEYVPESVRTLLTNHPRQVEFKEEDVVRLTGDLWEKLMPFQKIGVRTVLEHHGRFIIADEMGLGKTMQGLAVLGYYHRRDGGPSVVICPAAVLGSWEWHLKEHLGLGVNIIRDWRSEFHVGAEVVNLVSYGMLTSAKFQPKVKSFVPDVLIIDESHFIKSASAQRTRMVFQWTTRARRVLLLTGTPLNRTRDLFTQVNCVDRTVFPRFFHHKTHLPMRCLTTVGDVAPDFYYASRYCVPRLEDAGKIGRRFFSKGSASLFDFGRSENESELHAILKHRVLIRRTKHMVLKQLPPKIRERIILHEWKQDLNPGEDSDFMELVRETAREKTPHVVKYIREVVGEEMANDPSLKVLIWAHHHFLLDELEAATRDLLGDSSTVRIDGRTSAPQRTKLVQQFQENDDVRVAVLGLTAMGAGVTLTRATLSIMTELTFNPDIHLQAEDRSHRIGQELPVCVRYLICSESTDSIVWGLLTQKLRSSAMTVDGHERYLSGKHQPRGDTAEDDEGDLLAEKSWGDEKVATRRAKRRRTVEEAVVVDYSSLVDHE